MDMSSWRRITISPNLSLYLVDWDIKASHFLFVTWGKHGISSMKKLLKVDFFVASFEWGRKQWCVASQDFLCVILLFSVFHVLYFLFFWKNNLAEYQQLLQRRCRELDLLSNWRVAKYVVQLCIVSTFTLLWKMMA